ncbi:hypothetical protein DVH24_028176 [Malus domestica]|uniref:Uncharacterized protein n=1 Tax=Malus domestica TaxID=3750 RepID=A0A498HAJ2_MALDO|nr:hypothetical protein DVH24_028176 [Malus domestica]
MPCRFTAPPLHAVHILSYSKQPPLHETGWCSCSQGVFLYHENYTFCHFCQFTKEAIALFLRKTNENGLKTLSFNDKDKIKGKVNSTRIDFLV